MPFKILTERAKPLIILEKIKDVSTDPDEINLEFMNRDIDPNPLATNVINAFFPICELSTGNEYSTPPSNNILTLLLPDVAK